MAKPASTRRTQAADTRDSILRSAVAVMEDRGFPATRTSDVAEHAHVSTGLVLYHFSTREKLLTEALRFAEQQFLDVVAEQIRDVVDPRERLGLLLKLSLEDSENLVLPGSWLLWIDMWQQAVRNPSVRRDIEQLDGAWRQMLADTVRDGQAGGFFAPVDPDEFARMLSSLQDGLAIALLLGDSVLTKQLAIELCERLCRYELSIDGQEVLL
jgi:AcrR family transcriptional regulator